MGQCQDLALPSSPSLWVAGVDGCPAGWSVVLQRLDKREIRIYLLSSFAEVFELEERPRVIAVDIPIGLLDHAVPGGRICDRLVRQRLGRRGSSVFTPPVRASLRYDRSYKRASQVNRKSSPFGLGVSRQCFGLFRKMKEVDQVMTPALQKIVKECHPELSFWILNKGRSLAPKKTFHGKQQRQRLLRDLGYPPVLDSQPFSVRQVRYDDLLDACVLARTAERILKGEANRFPPYPPSDSRGLFMEIWG